MAGVSQPLYTNEACIKTFLEALEYPKRQDLDLTKFEQIHHLINWVENTKIRHYAIEDRAPLKSQNPSDFNAAVEKYCKDIDCPYPWDNSTDLKNPIRWILQHAVCLEYSDNVEGYTEALDKLHEEATPMDQWQPPPPPPFPDVNAPEVRRLVAEIRAKLNLETPPDMDLAAAVTELADKVENELKPVVNLIESEFEGRAPTAGDLLQRIPLGFSSGNQSVDDAARVLRVQHVQKLRELQTKIDEAIEEMQTLTANPKTVAGPAKRKAEN